MTGARWDPERVADDILARCRRSPGCSATELAPLLGLHVRLCPVLGTWILARYNAGTRTISVAARLSHREREMSIAHELMHAHQPPWASRTGLLEAWCDRGAASLLMPASAFIASGFRLQWSIDALARLWRHAPPKAIGRRMAELAPLAMLEDGCG